MKFRYEFLLIFFFCILAYVNSLKSNFVAEDYYLILNNEFIRDWDNVEVLFGKKNLVSPQPIRNGARPLTVFSLMLDHKIYNYNPAGFHFSNIIFHTLNTVLVFILFCVLGLKRDYSLTAAVIYAVHPIQAEVVNIPGFRGDLLAAFFFLIGVILFIKAVEQKKYYYMPFVAGAYLCAMLSKEIAITFPVILILYLVVFRPQMKKTIFFICAPMIICGALYMLFFWTDRYNYDIFNVVFVNLKGPMSPFTSYFTYINTIMVTIAHYAVTVFFPFRLANDYQIRIPEYISAASLAGIIIFISAIWGFFKLRDRVAKFGLGFFIITYIPASNLMPLFNIVADRYMYIPLAGFSCVMLVMVQAFIMGFQKDIEKSFKIRKETAARIPFIAGVCFIGVLFGLTFNRNYIFRDMVSLCENTVSKYPDNVRARYNLGIAYSEIGLCKESNRELMKAMELNRFYKIDKVWQTMGKNYQKLNRMDKAKECFVKLLWLNPELLRKTFQIMSEKSLPPRMNIKQGSVSEQKNK
ncbi:MAG: hypothetical protein ABIH89_01010 [Elusimicrobiota bacterium]